MTIETEVFTIKFNEYKKTNDSVCIFASFSHGNAIQEYVYFYLNEIKKANLDIIFVSSSSLDLDSIQNLKKYTSFIIEKTNEGLDFSSWQVGLSQIDFGRGYKNALLANDSVFGPFSELKKVINSGHLSDYEMYGLTDNYQIDYHIQSYFLYFKATIINSPAWLEFWSNIKILHDKKQIIVNYEIGLSQHMLKNGFKLGVLCSYDIIRKDLNIKGDYNSSHAFYKELITLYKFPFIKRELLIREGMSKIYEQSGITINIDSWRTILLNNTDYPVELIENYITHYFRLLQ